MTQSTYTAHIQIPAHSAPILYDYHPESNALFVRRYLETSLRYPCHVGFLSHTAKTARHPIEVLIVCPFTLQRGIHLDIKIMALLKMMQDNHDTSKVLAISNQLDTHISDYVLKQIAHFYFTFNDTANSVSQEWQGKDAALNYIEKRLENASHLEKDSLLMTT